MRRLWYCGILLLLLCLCGTVCAEEPVAAKTKKSAASGKGSAKKKAAAKKKSARKKGGKAAKAAAQPLPEPPKPLPPALVSELKHWSNPSYTRIAISLDREVPFEYHQLPGEGGGPPRIYLDLKGAKVASGVHDVPIGDGLLKMARVGQFKQDVTRVVLDIQNIREYKVFTFSDPFRVIIDVKGERPTEISRVEPVLQTAPPVPLTGASPAAAAGPPPADGKKPVAAPEVKKAPAPSVETAKGTVPPKLGKIRRIVVDAGHGGNDPGAVGAGGTREKDVVLAMALRLGERLREELGLDVVLTRKSDVFIELQERTAIANQVGADLFVSIHVNASPSRAVNGIETYYLNLAKTEKAAQLAARENGTSLEKVSLLQAVLFDLMANYKLNDSAHLADEVQKALYKRVSSRYNGTKNLGVKQGPFYVLVGATMPSILVEVAFLSNEREEERLRDREYQETAVHGILDGVRAYIASVR